MGARLGPVASSPRRPAHDALLVGRLGAPSAARSDSQHRPPTPAPLLGARRRAARAGTRARPLPGVSLTPAYRPPTVTTSTGVCCRSRRSRSPALLQRLRADGTTPVDYMPPRPVADTLRGADDAVGLPRTQRPSSRTWPTSSRHHDPRASRRTCCARHRAADLHPARSPDASSSCPRSRKVVHRLGVGPDRSSSGTCAGSDRCPATIPCAEQAEAGAGWQTRFLQALRAAAVAPRPPTASLLARRSSADRARPGAAGARAARRSRRRRPALTAEPRACRRAAHPRIRWLSPNSCQR